MARQYIQKPLVSGDASAENLVGLYNVLGYKARFNSLRAMYSYGELPTPRLAELTGVRYNTLNWHLNQLWRAGLVQHRSRGTGGHSFWRLAIGWPWGFLLGIGPTGWWPTGGG